MAELDEVLNEPSDSQKRITQLSDKVKTTADERDAAKTAQQTAEAAVAEAQRVAAFAEGFVDVVVANPAAKDHKDDIKAKVLAGYTLEDATFAVLGKAGKLGQPKAEAPASPAGGSATTSIPNNSGPKKPTEMAQADRRAALSEALEMT